MPKESSRQEIFDVLTNDSSRDGFDGDYRNGALEYANSDDVNAMRKALSNDMTESEAALYLGLRNW